jgi:hypothetical protein
LAAKLQLEIEAGTFDYAAWFPNGVRLRKLGLKPKELPTLAGFTVNAWLPLKTLGVRRSTRAYYQDVYQSLIERSDLANRRLSELSVADLDSWCLWLDTRLTTKGDKLSARRKNMARGIRCQILDHARRHYHIQDLTSGLKVFKDSEVPEDGDDPADDIRPFTANEVEKILGKAEGREHSLICLYFFTDLRRGEGLGLT